MEVALTRTACAARERSLYSIAFDIVTLLEQTPFDLAAEKITQAAIDDALVEKFGRENVSREHRLSLKDIPDFLVCGRVAVEVKGPRHREPAVFRQIERYAAHAEVEAVIVATARAMHLPRDVGGKPCRVVNLGRAWL